MAQVCVIGAGLTGATVALELAAAGVQVVLLDQDSKAVNRASLRNEGKIHLGLVFANDASLATSSLMLDGALSFGAILGRFFSSREEFLRISTPFTYLVAQDSLLSADELQDRYCAIEQLYRQKISADPLCDYLGRRPGSLFQRVQLLSLSPRIQPDGLLAAFRTEEVALDTAYLAEALRDSLARSANISLMPNRDVCAVERTPEGFRLTGNGPDGIWHLMAEQVVNASWENRHKIDRTIGVEHAPGCLYRLKFRVLARVPDRLKSGPSVTMVQGPYGDVVIRPDSTAYFSWYPRALQGWTQDLAPPDAWNSPCKGEVDPQTATAMAKDVLSAIDRWYPGAVESQPLLVDAGVIVAYGRSDVDDPDSGLHHRTHVGVTSIDGYHSVDPGKLTTAPLFASRVAQRVLCLDEANT